MEFAAVEAKDWDADRYLWRVRVDEVELKAYLSD